jgi:hypothetical protein
MDERRLLGDPGEAHGALDEILPQDQGRPHAYTYASLWAYVSRRPSSRPGRCRASRVSRSTARGSDAQTPFLTAAQVSPSSAKKSGRRSGVRAKARRVIWTSVAPRRTNAGAPASVRARLGRPSSPRTTSSVPRTERRGVAVAGRPGVADRARRTHASGASPMIGSAVAEARQAIEVPPGASGEPDRTPPGCIGLGRTRSSRRRSCARRSSPGSGPRARDKRRSCRSGARRAARSRGRSRRIPPSASRCRRRAPAVRARGRRASRRSWRGPRRDGAVRSGSRSRGGPARWRQRSRRAR